MKAICGTTLACGAAFLVAGAVAMTPLILPGVLLFTVGAIALMLVSMDKTYWRTKAK